MVSYLPDVLPCLAGNRGNDRDNENGAAAAAETTAAMFFVSPATK